MNAVGCGYQKGSAIGLTVSEAVVGLAAAAPEMYVALSDMASEIDSLHCAVEKIVDRLGPAMRGASGASNECDAVPAGPSEIVDRVMRLTENVRAARHRIADAYSRLTI